VEPYAWTSGIWKINGVARVSYTISCDLLLFYYALTFLSSVVFCAASRCIRRCSRHLYGSQ
jgi:hypothetical protein